MFSVTGHVPMLDRTVTVQWADGELSGDPAACDVLRAYAREREGQAVGPVEGPYTVTQHLADGLSTVMLMRDVFAADAVWSGDVPVRPAIPFGAIGHPVVDEQEEETR